MLLTLDIYRLSIYNLIYRESIYVVRYENQVIAKFSKYSTNFELCNHHIITSIGRR